FQNGFDSGCSEYPGRISEPVPIRKAAPGEPLTDFTDKSKLRKSMSHPRHTFVFAGAHWRLHGKNILLSSYL
ncbi:hypothetical protein, partial [Paraburkholderia ribeironis]|uniref:hypothetical protein n=1 Tax=Paraburkholderia ribeironis TaxID=1247936 RepID=UPI001C3FED3C